MRWKQLFQINCEVENIYLPVPLSKRSNRLTLVQEADSAFFLDIPRTCENMAYKYSKISSEQHNGHFKRKNSNKMPPCFVSSLQPPLLFLFTHVQCCREHHLLTKLRFAAGVTRSKPDVGNTPFLFFIYLYFYFVTFRSLLKIFFIKEAGQ